MGHSVIFAGLDVHAARTHAAQLEAATGQMVTTRLAGGSEPVLEWLRRLGPGVVAVYEAGPTGFGLARQAKECGVDLRVVTPGLIPKRPTDRVKTDRRDAIRLARLLAAGELPFARVPTVAEEQFRDLVRAREDLRTDLMRARHRLSKLLLRRQLIYPGPGKAWTQAHMAWLASLALDDVASQTTLVDYLTAVTTLLQRRSRLDATIERLVPEQPLRGHGGGVAVLPWHRHVVSGGAVRRDRYVRPLRPSQPAGRLSGDRAQRAHQRQQAPPGCHHQGRARPRPRSPGRSGPPLPPPTTRRDHLATPPTRPGPTRVRCRLARPTTPVPAMATPAQPTSQARRCRRRGLRSRTVRVSVGGRHHRLTTHTTAPGRRCRDAHEHPQGPDRRIPGSAS